MRTASEMGKVITQLAEIYGLDLKKVGEHIKLEMEGFFPLVVETVGKNQVSVTHYRYENGDAVQDPEIVFLANANPDAWLPLNITQMYIGQRICATAKSDGSSLELANLSLVAEISKFANLWARNIEAQGWLEPNLIKKVTH